MKKVIIFILLIMILIPTSTVLAKSDIKIYLNNEQIEAKGTMVNGSTLVPLRAIFEALGASVEWDGTTKTVISKKNNVTIQLVIGEKTAKKNGKDVALVEPGQIIAGSTFVPLRFVGEAFGGTVEWDGTTRSAKITTNINDELIMAILSNDLNTVIYLLEVGANPNYIDYLGMSPLYNSIPITEDDDVTIARILLEAGADPNLISDTGSILYSSVMYTSIEMIDLLLEYGADIHARSLSGNTPLDLAKEKSENPHLNEKYKPIIEEIIAMLEGAEKNNNLKLSFDYTYELEEYLNKYYSIVETPLCKYKFDYEIVDSTYLIFNVSYFMDINLVGTEVTDEEKLLSEYLLREFLSGVDQVISKSFPELELKPYFNLDSILVE